MSEGGRLDDRPERLPVAGVHVGDRAPDRVRGDLKPADVDRLVDDVVRGTRMVGLVDEVVPLDVVVPGQVVGEGVVLLPLPPEPGPRRVPAQLGRRVIGVMPSRLSSLTW